MSYLSSPHFHDEKAAYKFVEARVWADVRWPQPGKLLSWWDIMKDLNAERFLQTVTLVSNIRAQIQQWTSEAKGQQLTPDFRTFMARQFSELSAATEFIGAELAQRASERYKAQLEDQAFALSVDDMRVAISDVENRLTDEISLMGFIVLDRVQYGMLKPAADLVDWDIERIFPDASRELAEAAKCLALQRSTAAVFHAMRMLEIGIKKFAELLEIPDPVEPAKRNWANILKEVKAKLDEKYPQRNRMPGSKGAAFSEIYASLDAIKHPWRNGTMHVEGFYTHPEANQLLTYTAFLMRKLGAYCQPDEVSEDPSGGVIQESQ